ncbi:MAG TPA: hypothetical protein VGJ70_05550, partial [Solirubrobacteraceae bacterium]
APAAADVTVVPPGQAVAGRSYAEWQVAWWQALFARPAGASPCPSRSAGAMTFLYGGVSGKPETHTCSIPADQPLYIPGIGLECSTLEKAPFHGSTAAQLKACARRLWGGQKVGMTATMDGQAVANLLRYTIATDAFAIRLPKKNILSSRKRSGRSAAKGVGLIFTGLSAGKHTLHVTGRFPRLRFKGEVTYALNVR